MAKYFEPAGAVSWDVSMTATKPDWKVALKQGDRLNVSTTYDTSKASWYEVDGDHGHLVRRRQAAQGQGPVQVEGRHAAGCSPTAICARTAITAASRA